VVVLYRGYTIHTVAIQATDGLWNAEARVRRVRSQETPYITTVRCRKATPDAAETVALVTAQYWVDRRELGSA
jgi:hypothetical protein